jgi:hypothetical protein
MPDDPGEQGDVQLRCIRLDKQGRGSTLVSIEHRGVSARIAD